MPFKSTTNPAGNYPNTYMEQFCRALHPDLEMGKVCVAWFRQAVKHCTYLLRDVRAPTAYFWTTVKNLIFPDKITEIMSNKAPIHIHPKRLTRPDCQSLFLDIASDYVQRAPRYAAESATNSMLWQVIYSLLGIMAMGMLSLGTIYAYYKYGKPKKMFNVSEEVFRPHKRMQAIAARSLRLASTELRIFKTQNVPRKEDIIAMDGSSALVLKVGSRYEFLESLVQGALHSVGKFHRLHVQHDKSKSEFKIESLNKALKFMENSCQKIHLIIAFEDEKYLETEEAAREQHKSSLLPNARNSPRGFTASTRQICNIRLEGRGAWQKQCPATTPRSSTPRQQNIVRSTNTPRASSGIPLNVQKTSPGARKSK